MLVVLHGLTGCADSDNVMALAAKAHELGFDVVRVDLRNTQADDAPSLGIGHAGRSEDLRAVIRHAGEVQQLCDAAIDLLTGDATTAEQSRLIASTHLPFGSYRYSDGVEIEIGASR